MQINNSKSLNNIGLLKFNHSKESLNRKQDMLLKNIDKINTDKNIDKKHKNLQINQIQKDLDKLDIEITKKDNNNLKKETDIKNEDLDNNLVNEIKSAETPEEKKNKTNSAINKSMMKVYESSAKMCKLTLEKQEILKSGDFESKKLQIIDKQIEKISEVYQNTMKIVNSAKTEYMASLSKEIKNDTDDKLNTNYNNKSVLKSEKNYGDLEFKDKE